MLSSLTCEITKLSREDLSGKDAGESEAGVGQVTFRVGSQGSIRSLQGHVQRLTVHAKSQSGELDAQLETRTSKLMRKEELCDAIRIEFFSLRLRFSFFFFFSSLSNSLDFLPCDGGLE